jgi:tetratricopeptide (TPR) repeat protein
MTRSGAISMNRRFFRTGIIFALGAVWAAAMPAQSQHRGSSKADQGTTLSLEKVKAALKRDPANSKLWVDLGLVFWDHSDYPNALQSFQQAVKVGPNYAEAHNWFGVALMQHGDFPPAIAEFRKAISLNPKYGRAYTNLGSALSKSGNLAEGIQVFQKALALEPDSLAAHLNFGIALRENGDAKDALIHLRRVARAEPGDPKLQYEIGQALEQTGDLAGAVAAYERALKINPALAEAYYALGVALKQQSAASHKPAPSPSSDDSYKQAQDDVAKGDLEDAKQQLEKSLQANENNADAHSLLGYILGQQGDLPSALQHLQRAVALRPESVDAHYNLGAALWYSGSSQKAISELESSVRLDPAAGSSYALLALAQRDTGNLEGARANLERALALLPPAAATYIDLGIVFLREGELDKAMGQLEAGLNLRASVGPTPDWDGAIAGLRTLIRKKPARADAHNMLGLLLGRKGADSNQVLAEFREAIRLNPNYAEAHNSMGLVLAQTNDDDGAIKEFREAIRIHPDYAEAHANLGSALMLTDVEGAIPELEKAVELDPASVEALFNLAEAYGNSPSHGTAKQIEALRKVVSMAPTFARGHLALGKALLHDGKLDDAVTQLQEATRLDHQSGEAHYQLGLALARAGKQAEATAEVQKGRQLSAADDRNQNASLDISEGLSAFQKDELQEAAAKFQHAIKLTPDSANAHHYLGMVFEKQGDTADAIIAYQKAVSLNPGDTVARQSLDRLQAPEAPSPQSTQATAANPKAAPSGDDAPHQMAEFENYIRQGKFKEAEPLLTDYVTQNPNSSWGWYALGYCQFGQKKIADSIQSLARALSLNVQNAEAHKILGRDLMIIGRFDAAQTEFQQGIRYDPKSAENHYDLAKLFALQENWDEARKEYEAAVQIDPSYIEAIEGVAFAHEALGDDANAVQNYKKVIALNDQQHGTFVAAHVGLSAYYNRTGDPAQALDYAEQALQLDPKSDSAWFQKAKAQESQAHLEDAVDSLNHATAINPHFSTYFYALAQLDRRLGRIEDSQKALAEFTHLTEQTNKLEKMRRDASAKATHPHRDPGQ